MVFQVTYISHTFVHRKKTNSMIASSNTYNNQHSTIYAEYKFSGCCCLANVVVCYCCCNGYAKIDCNSS